MTVTIFGRTILGDKGYIKLSREAEQLLLSDPQGFLLLTLIAMRAGRKYNPITKLQKGECFVGDYAKIGLSRDQYRRAIKRLTSAHQITTQATNRGTIATICESALYDVNIFSDNHQAPIQNPQGQHERTTKEEEEEIVKKENIKRKKAERNHSTGEKKALSALRFYESQLDDLTSSTRDIAPAAAESYRRFVEYLGDKAPKLLQLDDHLPFEKFTELRNQYGPETFRDVINDMQNHRDLLKKYSSMRLTLQSWLKRRVSQNAPPQLTPMNTRPR